MARQRKFGFHYNPYNSDSNPEKSFFEQLLEHIGLHPDKVEDIYFTGAITDPRKTDFFVEYKDEDGKWHRYTPDFIIRRKDGKCLIVEIKAEDDRDPRHQRREWPQGDGAPALGKSQSRPAQVSNDFRGRQHRAARPNRNRPRICGGLNRHASNQENQNEEGDRNAAAATKPAAPKLAGGKKARATKPTPAAETPAPPKQTTVNITAAKGRPMLSWVGKRPLRHVTAFPAQHVETFNPDWRTIRQKWLAFSRRQQGSLGASARKRISRQG